jgi:hypothetical protein
MMHNFKPLSDRIAYQILKRFNRGDNILTEMDFKRYQKRVWGVKPTAGDRPVCKFWWPEKIDLVLQSVVKTEALGGDIVELGAYQGGGTMLIAERLREGRSPRKVWALDSFQGYPPPTDFDRMDDGRVHYAEGHHGDTSAAAVHKMLKLFDLDAYVHIRAGFFETTVPQLVNILPPISLLILDCNHYRSTKLGLEMFYDRLQPQGMILIDDYRRPEQPYHPEAPGVKKAVDEFLVNKPEMLQHGAYSMWFLIKT